ncbi:MAG: hypothetical protein AAF940_15230, partial [Pseudomonadota bacterium]
MKKVQDTALVLSFAAILAGASLFALAKTDLGDVSTGWTNGAYQRGYETRFDRSVPGQMLAVNAWSALRWGTLREAASGVVVGREGWLFTAEEFREPVETHDLREQLIRTADSLAKKNIALVPIIVPDKARMHANLLPRPRSPGFEQRYDRALQTIKAAGLPTVDLRQALNFDVSFMRQDTHWSPEGAHSAAEAIAAAISDDRETVAVTTTSLGFEAFDGDLLSYVNTGLFRPLVGPRTEQIEKFKTIVESGGGLFGDAPAPIALVGTSYSA